MGTLWRFREMMVPVHRTVSLPGEPSEEGPALAPGFLSELGPGSSRTVRSTAALLAQEGRGDIGLPASEKICPSRKKFGGFIWHLHSVVDTFTSPCARSKLVPLLVTSLLMLKIPPVPKYAAKLKNLSNRWTTADACDSKWICYGSP